MNFGFFKLYSIELTIYFELARGKKNKNKNISLELKPKQQIYVNQTKI